MAEETPSEKKPEPLRPAIEESAKEEKAPLSRVLIRPLPKLVFLWPTVLMAIICWVLEDGMPNTTTELALGRIFLIVLALNLPVIAFDFSRVSFLVLVLVVILFGVLKWITPVFDFIGSLEIGATKQFYGWFAVILVLQYFIVFIKTRFDYWELTHNELLHHHGILGDVERYPAPGLRITKEVNDVFEFILLGAGRLVIQAQDEDRALVLQNIPLVNRVEKRMKELLSTLQVKVGGVG